MSALSDIQTKLPWSGQPAKFPTITIAVAGEQVLAAELPPGRYTIGGSPLSDFCLPMLAEDQLCIMECQTEDKHEVILLENIAPSLSINKSRASSPSQEITLTSPLILQVDDVVIEIRSQRILRNYTPIAFFVAALCLLFAGWWVSTPEHIGMAPMQAVTSTRTMPLPTSDAVMQELRTRIVQTDLAGRLTVHQEQEGIVVRGQLARNLTTLWREVLVNIRQRSQVRVRAEVSPIPQEADGRAEIAGVLLEPRKALIGRDDRVRLEGEELPSGWTIESISQQSVRLGREGLIDIIALPGMPVQAGNAE